MSADILIGIDLGGSNVRAGLVTRDGTVLATESRATLVEEGVEAVHDRMAALAIGLIEQGGVSREQVLAIGVGSPGPLDSRAGVIRWAVNLPGWKDVNVVEEMQGRTGLRCFLENDAVSAAWGEFWLGAARRTRSMIMLTLGTGVGGAIILGGEVLRGPDDSAGHLGHVTVDYRGRDFPTGNRGALEAYASAGAIVERYREAAMKAGQGRQAPEEVTCAQVAERAAEGCETARAVFEETGVILGAFLAGMANALNPEVAVIGGGVAAAGELLFGPMRLTCRERAFPAAGARMKIVPAELGNEAGFLGAGGLALHRLEKE